MVAALLFLFAALGFWKTGQYVSAFIEEHDLLEHQRDKLRRRCESWWSSVAGMEPRLFAVALAGVTCNSIADYFGQRLFSKRAFTRSSAIATVLLATSLAITGLMGKGVNPVKEFEKVVQLMRDAPARAKANVYFGKDKKYDAIQEKLKTIAERYDHWGWKAAHSLAFFGMLVVLNCSSFFLSIALSRLMLKETVESGRVFPACCLLVLNVFLVVCTSSAFLLITTVLAYPGLWFLLPLVCVFSKLSIYWLFVAAFGGGIAVWALGNPTLKICAVIAVSPCLATALTCLFSAGALLKRRRFRQLCSGILIPCTGKKALSFLFGVFGFVAIVIALICRLL